MSATAENGANIKQIKSVHSTARLTERPSSKAYPISDFGYLLFVPRPQPARHKNDNKESETEVTDYLTMFHCLPANMITIETRAAANRVFTLSYYG